ncbi:MAG: NAD(P)/FAD-dependent oxidoreductase, partial [Methermicoccaceae archaeon]
MRVVVVGGGVAGAELVRCASPSDELELFVIEPKQQIECQALYPDYLSANVQLEDITAPLKPFCERTGATLISERALKIEGGEVVCTSTTVAYDVVVIATGAAQNYYGIVGAERAFSINTLESTLKAREFIERESPETIVVVGSGLTGVESASGLVEALEAQIYMVEMMDRVLPTFPERTSSKVRRALDEMGVHIITSKSVAEICEKSVVL